MSDDSSQPDTLAQVLEPRRSMQWALVDDELIVFDNTSRVFHRLNPTATAVWVELDGVVSLHDVIELLAERYGVEPTIVQSDVATLANQFDDQRLLATSEPPEPPAKPWVPALEPSTSALVIGYEETIDRHDWAVSVGPFSAFAFRFALVCDDDEVGVHLADTLAPLAMEDGGAPVRPGSDMDVRTYVVRRPRSSPDSASTAVSEAAREAGTSAVDPREPDIDPTAADEASEGEPAVPEPFATSVADNTDRWRFFLGGRHVQTTVSRSGMVDHLFWHVNRMATETDSAHTMFHAAGASWDGAGILMPGQQNAGKSTLVTGLVAAGLGYLGDEAIALDAQTAWMLPFHKSIGLDMGSWPLFPEFEPDADRAELQPSRWHVPPDRVRQGSRAPSAPVRFIVCPQYQQDAETTLEPMSDIDAVAILLEQAFHLADRPDALEQLVSMVKAAECRRLAVSNLADSVRLVSELVGAPIPEP